MWPPPSILVRVELVTAGHDDDAGRQGMDDVDRAGMRIEMPKSLRMEERRVLH